MKQASFIFTHPPEDQKQETKKRNKKNDSRHGHRARTLHLAAELNVEQRHIFDVVTDAALNNTGGLFMINASAGAGKSFTQCATAAHIRAQRKLVLRTASTGIAALILPGGLTAHSTFRLPFGDKSEIKVVYVTSLRNLNVLRCSNKPA